MSLRARQDPHVAVFVRDCPHGDDATLVRVRKAWWAVDRMEWTSRGLYEFCIPNDGSLQDERIARALEAAAAAIRG